VNGRLILVTGPSGAGKDTLISGAARLLADDAGFVFPRRSITRPADAGGEDHVCLTTAAFDAAEAQGAFALSWRAHGLAYGVPALVARDLVAGRAVVVNVSRSVVEEARRRFDEVAAIAIEVPRAALAQRLAARGRETEGEIALRLERAEAAPAAEDAITFINDGPIETCVARFAALLRELAPGSAR